MRLEEHKLRTYSLNDWVEAFDQVYSQINKDRTIEGIMLHLVEHTGEIQEDVRIGRYHQSLIHLADAFCWTCAVVRRASTEYGTDQSYNAQVRDTVRGRALFPQTSMSNPRLAPRARALHL